MTLTNPFTAIRNLLAPEIAIELPLEQPTAGAIVRDADGSLCAIERIGWLDGELSPYYGYDVLQAYVFGFNEDGSVWCDWLDLHTLSTDAVGAKDISRFCDYVVADLESLKRSFSVVRQAIIDCECGEAA